MYIPYWKWECYKSGMWSKASKADEGRLLAEAIAFTGDHKKYGLAMRDVVCRWKHTMLNHLTNTSINRRAFLGHCAVCYRKGIPEYLVRKAWKHLTDEQRRLADLEAENTIKEWELWYMKESENISKHGKKGATKTGYQMKLQLSYKIEFPRISE